MFYRLVEKNTLQPILLRHTVIVEEYDFKKILNIILDIISKSKGRNWEEISSKLSRYFYWEFEDYLG